LIKDENKPESILVATVLFDRRVEKDPLFRQSCLIAVYLLNRAKKSFVKSQTLENLSGNGQFIGLSDYLS
jgi:hypothetical protein